MWDRDDDWEEKSNPNIWVYPVPDCGVQVPTRMRRKMVRGDTLFFTGTIYQLSTTGQLFTVPTTNPITSPPSNSVPFNLTGAEIWFTAKNNKADPDQAAIFALNTAALGGVAILVAAAGTYSVTGPSIATSGFADSKIRLFADTQIKDATGRISTVEIGPLDVFPDATRSIT